MKKHLQIGFAALLFILGNTLIAEDCTPCDPAELHRELRAMYRAYRAAVNEAQANGYQCGSDPDYVDYGPLMTKLGNCADWTHVTWSALTVKKTWKCWRVRKIRARRRFWFTHHHFVYIEPRCGGTPIYFDPWTSGRPDVFIGDDLFDFSNGLFGAWIHYPLDVHQPGAPGRAP